MQDSDICWEEWEGHALTLWPWEETLHPQPAWKAIDRWLSKPDSRSPKVYIITTKQATFWWKPRTYPTPTPKSNWIGCQPFGQKGFWERCLFQSLRKVQTRAMFSGHRPLSLPENVPSSLLSVPHTARCVSCLSYFSGSHKDQTSAGRPQQGSRDRMSWVKEKLCKLITANVKFCSPIYASGS